jgi:hypothetical protein
MVLITIIPAMKENKGMSAGKIIFILLLLTTQTCFSQSDTLLNKRHELGVDITNTLTFLKKNSQSYLLNYRYFFLQNRFAARAGLNLDISNGESDGYYPDIKMGIQKNTFDNKWMTYYGIDLSFSYFKSNATPISTKRFGITPFVGVGYFINKRVSFSTEAGINFNKYFLHSKNSFDPVDKTSYSRINIGYIGMFVAGYHF